MKLKIDSLSKHFENRNVLKGVSLDIAEAHSLVLIGPSGGGKTTLLRILAGLEIPDTGRVEINGKPLIFREDHLHEHRKKIGVVFQAFNLFPHLTALENITLSLEKVHLYSAAEAKDRAIELLKRFHLDEHASKKPFALSGGQRQRVAIVRGVAAESQMLLLDEPTSSLDPEMTSEVLDLIAELKIQKKDFIMVTHQIAFARSVADRVAFLAQGTIMESGTSEEVLLNSKTERCRKFLERTLKY